MYNGFKGTDMTCMLNISRATLNRRRKDFNLEISHSFSTIDDDTLDGIVRSKQQQHQKLYLHDHKGITVLQKLLV